MSTDEFMYEELVQEALRGVVRRVLSETTKDGLTGSNYFYITFQTDYPGVVVPSFLSEKHPENITIVLQHQFWDLEVTDKAFSVTLSFFDTHERLTIPFHALLNFSDPSVKFGLQFTPPEAPEEEESAQPSLSIVENDSEDKVVSLDTFRKK